MEEVGGQVAAPLVSHQTLAQRFCDTHRIAKKRGLLFNSSSCFHQSTSGNWDPKSWGWDSSRFVVRPLECGEVQVVRGAQRPPELSNRRDEENNAFNLVKPGCRIKNDEGFRLILGGSGSGTSSSNGGINPAEEPQPVVRPNKRVRSGSPAGLNRPMCQVDDCDENLSDAKDYHRRHKVCEIHSKATKAFVGKQMQRFCQQCSRFHPLSEFDEGKRSCRRRLAGHNRRRRKTQPEDSTPPVVVPDSPQDYRHCDRDIINLLSVLARGQGSMTEGMSKFSNRPEKYQLMQILSRIDSLPLPMSVDAKLPHVKPTRGSSPNNVGSENQNQIPQNASCLSTMDLLASLSSNPAAPSSDVSKVQSLPSTNKSDLEKRMSNCVDQVGCLKSQGSSMMEFTSVGGERSSAIYHSSVQAGYNAQETSRSLDLQLFNSSPEDDSARELPSSKNCISSNSRYPSEERSPTSSPALHDLFPMQTSRVTSNSKGDAFSNSDDEVAYEQLTMNNGSSTILKLFGRSVEATENGSVQSSSCRAAGSTSTSGSDHSQSSLNSDSRNRSGRLLFKLFDKDPSHLPGSLRTQICSWLSNSPSEMESYIRPGCIILSLYLLMPVFAWEQLEENLLDYVNSLVKDIDVDLWGSGRFLFSTESQMISHKDGKIRLCRSLKAWVTPQLISVSPVAVVAGRETPLLLRGRNLKAAGTLINCTHADGFNIREVPASSSGDDAYDEICLDSFKISTSACRILGRCFIEIDNSFRGSRFPLIIADKTICHELRRLEPNLHVMTEICDGSPTNHIQNKEKLSSREEVLHFLDELGWLFQRKSNSFLFETPEYRISRFKFLLVFSVGHDLCTLVKTLLDILLELNLGKIELSTESLEMLSEIHLLNRAVKRRCLLMVDLLIQYSILGPDDASRKFVFAPNVAGPGGITPLHLAACASSSDDIVDALTNDPLEIGLQSWNSTLDANGLSPHAYASMMNNHSYNTLVARKLADSKNGQFSVPIIEDGVQQFSIELRKEDKNMHGGQTSCSDCAVSASLGYRIRSPGILRLPYIHSMLVIAAVCACVCLFLRGHPSVGDSVPFAWENLGYGTS